MEVICLNTQCEYYRDEVKALDGTNCRINMWDEISDCPHHIIGIRPESMEGSALRKEIAALKAKIVTKVWTCTTCSPNRTPCTFYVNQRTDDDSHVPFVCPLNPAEDCEWRLQDQE